MGFFDSVGNALASIDPSKSISNAATKVDKVVNQVPGGWGTVGALTLAAASPYLAPQLFGSNVGMVDSAGNIIGGGSQGAALGGTAAGSGSWGLSPELASDLGLDYSSSGLTDLSGKAGSAALSNLGLNTAGGMSAAQKALLLRSGMSALNQITGGTGGGGYSAIGGGNAAPTYQRQNPYLSTAQQNTVPDTTTETLIKLLRGYNG